MTKIKEYIRNRNLVAVLAAIIFIAIISQYFGEREGTNGPVYVGALIVALFLLGCFIVKGSIKWILLGLTILSVSLAWGAKLYAADRFIHRSLSYV